MKKINKNIKPIVLYIIFGIFTTFINLISYYALILTILDSKNTFQLQIANIISWILSVFFAYITNKKYVFNNKNKITIKEFKNFMFGRIATLIIDMIIMFIFVSLLGFNNKIIKIISQIIVILINYIISKCLVFNSKSKKNKQ